ncbi:MAG: hypothetical protein ACOH1L_11645 [Thermomonas sp.]
MNRSAESVTPVASLADLMAALSASGPCTLELRTSVACPIGLPSADESLMHACGDADQTEIQIPWFADRTHEASNKVDWSAHR